ncbi:MAG: DUF4199 domain-containing protein [Prevotella sp.]|nr:DUF4199 domain-containing protein [Prevotella sp.]
MTLGEKIHQLRAFAGIDGLLLALIWISSFGCYLGQFGHPALSIVWMLFAVSTPFFVAFRLRHFRDEALDGSISFRRAFAYCIMVFLYASILFALAQWAYFNYVDQGFLLSQFGLIMHREESQAVLEAYKLTPEMLDTIMEDIGKMTPIDLSLGFANMNLTGGFFMSLIIAAIMRK